MFNTRYKPTRGKEPRKPPPGDGRKDGIFSNGVWSCNCNPRLPASRLQVRKDNQNKGRFFYTCSLPQGEQCGFFLFEDAARSREGQENRQTTLQYSPLPAPPSSASAMGSPSPSPSRRGGRGATARDAIRIQSPTTEMSTSDELEISLFGLSAEVKSGAWFDKNSTAPQDSPSAFIPPPAHSAGSKRKISAVDPADPDDESFDRAPTSSEEREMIRLVEESEKTPKKVTSAQEPASTRTEPTTADAAGGMAAPGTPNPGRCAPGDLPTPVSRDTLAIAADLPKAIPGESGTHQDSSTGPEAYELTREVMRLLRDTPMRDVTRKEVREFLDGYSLRMRGVYTARDLSQSMLKSKELSISYLQDRIVALENERKADKEHIKGLDGRVERLEQHLHLA